MYRTLFTRIASIENHCKSSFHLSFVQFQGRSKTDGQQKQTSSMANATNDEVKFEKKNKAGVVILNKPKTLNALSLPMIEQIYPKLKQWENDGQTDLVIVKSSTPKAFCAGGDIKALLDRSATGAELRRAFFREEYKLNYLTGNYKLPYVAIINGITMGGGCGLSVHGPFRIATETTTIAMPETAIGLFPDVGGAHFLPRLSNNLGVFLGLTGHRLRGADVLHAGIATHYVPSSRLDEVEEKLVQLPKATHQTVKDLLDKICEPANSQGPFSLKEHLSLIDCLFSIKTKNVETILQQLKTDGSEFALKQLAILEKMSPTSMKLTFEQLKRGEKLNLKDCLIMEYRMVQHVMSGHDFFEGVRAEKSEEKHTGANDEFFHLVLVDKDNKPQWKPKRLEDLSDAEVAKYFDKLSSNEDLQLS